MSASPSFVFAAPPLCPVSCLHRTVAQEDIRNTRRGPHDRKAGGTLSVTGKPREQASGHKITKYQVLFRRTPLFSASEAHTAAVCRLHPRVSAARVPELSPPNPSLPFCLSEGQHRSEALQPAPGPRGSVKQTAAGNHCLRSPS